MARTHFIIGNKHHVLKYMRKMPEGEVKRMKSFMTNKGTKLEKTNKFKIISVEDKPNTRLYKVIL
jgi:hypothetical protein